MYKYIEEDFERLSDLDKMYIVEKEREMIEEWQQWEEEQEEKVAKIRLIMPNMEEYDKKRQESYKES